jgi:hypothetical protein
LNTTLDFREQIREADYIYGRWQKSLINADLAAAVTSFIYKGTKKVEKVP